MSARKFISTFLVVAVFFGETGFARGGRVAIPDVSKLTPKDLGLNIQKLNLSRCEGLSVNTNGALAAAANATGGIASVGGGCSDGSGGGTFIFQKGTRSFTFWDLWQKKTDYPYHGIYDGQKFKLSPTGAKAHGEWVDSRTLEAHKEIERSFRIEGKEGRNLKRLLDAVGADEIPLIFTDLPITKVTEIAIPERLEDLAEDVWAMPGAYFDGKRIFINIEIWNLADLDSQAAMLLHERLRTLQPYLMLSNDDLQSTVARLMDIESEELDNFEIEKRFSKERVLQRIRPLSKSPASGARRPPAEQEIRQAVKEGILSEKGEPQPGVFISNGAKNALSKKYFNMVIFDPTRCVELLEGRRKSDGSSLKCLPYGWVGGRGTIHSGLTFSAPTFDSDVEIMTSEEKAKFALEVVFYQSRMTLDRKLYQGPKIEGTRTAKIEVESSGDNVRITLNGGEAFDLPKESLLSTGKSRVVRFKFLPEDGRIDVFDAASKSAIPVASWLFDLRGNFKPKSWNFTMDGGLLVGAFRYAEHW